MRIGYVADTFGTRQLKQSLALIAMGHEVFVYPKVWHDPSFRAFFANRVSYWNDTKQLETMLSMQGAKDAYIVRFDLATWLPRFVVSRTAGVGRVIVDINDDYPHYTEADWGQLRCAQGVLIPCAGFRDLSGYGVAVHVVENRTPFGYQKIADARPQSGPCIENSIGYAGGADLNSDYRDYRALASHCRDAGVSLFIYSDMPSEAEQEYSHLGAWVIRPRSYFDMIASLKRHTYIWAGSHGPVMDRVVRNALFDGLLTGRPVITYNLPNQAGRAHVDLEDFESLQCLTPMEVIAPERAYLEEQLKPVFT